MRSHTIQLQRAAVPSIGTSRAEPDGAPRPLKVCLINPKFEPSYWGMDFVLPLMDGDKRCWVVTGALPALAALAPSHCTVELIDENVEAIDFDRIASFDVIGVTGMIVQRERMRAILARVKDFPATVVAGGPYVSVAPETFEGLCDAMFIGEAEETWPAFLTDLGKGLPVQQRYQQPEKSDMQLVPPPRYDLVKSAHYMTASLQFSRGCPFLCEFCDIITIFGRRPRLKTTDQMIAEFDAIVAAGFHSCFLVDDNFIGNKVKAKELLRALIVWQRSQGKPIMISTEASINLADDQELLELMVAANFRQVFIGIETPSKAALVETRKLQNIRGDSIEEKIQRIRNSGLVVQAGFIVGFDSDTASIFDEQFEFIQGSGITQSLVAILSPIPTTPLYERLRAEGRLDLSDPHVAFHPKLMSREVLKDGFDQLTRRLYAPDTYFERLFRGYAGSPDFRRIRALQQPQGNWRAGVYSLLAGVRQAVRLARTMARHGYLWRLGGSYLKIWRLHNRPLGKEAFTVSAFVAMCCVHWHFFKLSRQPRRAGFGTVLDLQQEQPTAQKALPPDQLRRDADQHRAGQRSSLT